MSAFIVPLLLVLASLLLARRAWERLWTIERIHRSGFGSFQVHALTGARRWHTVVPSFTLPGEVLDAEPWLSGGAFSDDALRYTLSLSEAQALMERRGES